MSIYLTYLCTRGRTAIRRLPKMTMLSVDFTSSEYFSSRALTLVCLFYIYITINRSACRLDAKYHRALGVCARISSSALWASRVARRHARVTQHEFDTRWKHAAVLKLMRKDVSLASKK
jgi:hypothetical protein